jgi:hypothetical protein
LCRGFTPITTLPFPGEFPSATLSWYSVQGRRYSDLRLLCVNLLRLVQLISRKHGDWRCVESMAIGSALNVSSSTEKRACIVHRSGLAKRWILWWRWHAVEACASFCRSLTTGGILGVDQYVDTGAQRTQDYRWTSTVTQRPWYVLSTSFSPPCFPQSAAAGSAACRPDESLSPNEPLSFLMCLWSGRTLAHPGNQQLDELS